MRLLDNTDTTVSIEISHEHALMIVALVREACFGTVMQDFETRVGYSPRRVGEIARQLHEILETINVSE